MVADDIEAVWNELTTGAAGGGYTCPLIVDTPMRLLTFIGEYTMTGLPFNVRLEAASMARSPALYTP